MPGLDKDCEKAARILKGFVEKHRIPTEVIANAKGLAIFSGFRAAMMLAGAGGSGIVVARQADGSWSAPSGFSVISGGVGAAYGLDVYDCVCVLNTQAAVNAYTKTDFNLGADVRAAAGPIGGAADISIKDITPVWTYVKSRGLYGAIAVDGTVIKQRPGANAEAYGSKVTAADILSGQTQWPTKTQLLEVLKSAEGKKADARVLGAISTEPTPGDL